VPDGQRDHQRIGHFKRRCIGALNEVSYQNCFPILISVDYIPEVCISLIVDLLQKKNTICKGVDWGIITKVKRDLPARSVTLSFGNVLQKWPWGISLGTSTSLDLIASQTRLTQK
jgi:hypothetical protein